MQKSSAKSNENIKNCTNILLIMSQKLLHSAISQIYVISVVVVVRVVFAVHCRVPHTTFD